MRVALVGFLRDHGEEVQVGRRDLQTRFLESLAHGAFERRLARGHLQLAADGRPHPEIGLLGAQHEQLLAGGVFNEDQDADFVGQNGTHWKKRDLCGKSGKQIFHTGRVPHF